jgi:hypothetical protein
MASFGHRLCRIVCYEMLCKDFNNEIITQPYKSNKVVTWGRAVSPENHQIVHRISFTQCMYVRIHIPTSQAH